MSFFEDDEPTTVQRAPRPRRDPPPRRPAGGRGGGGGGADVDAATLRTRRLVAGGGALVVLIVLVLLFNACQDSRKKNGLRDYNRDTNELLAQSEDQVVAPLFQALSQASGQTSEDLQTTISGLRAQAQTDLDRAKDQSAPSDMATAQQAMLIALELRRDGVQYIADRSSRALGNEGAQADEAVREIAGQMQAFLAADVLVRTRVTPTIRNALASNDIVADPASTDGSLPSLDWLQPSFVADQLGTSISGGGGDSNSPDEQERDPDGLYGTSLDSTTVGDTALEPDPASNRAPVADARTISVAITNGGEADERNIPVTVTLQGSGSPIEGRGEVESIAQGESATATVRLPSAPSTGEVYVVTVEVGAVPDEKNTDNNTSAYNVLFE